jgi:hypothetical protein
MWQILDTIMPNWHWYNDTIQTLDSRGFSGTTEGQWNQAGIILPRNLTESPLMKFRMAFASDGVNNSTGFAFDNFSIFKAPMDIGATVIEDFTDACQYINPDSLTITITNFGINSIEETDTIIAGFDLNNTKVVIDTFHVSEVILPGQTFQHTFSKPVDAILPGAYVLSAYTLSEDDPWFYAGNNDSTGRNFIVFPAPTVNLFDTIQTREPDTVVISPFFHPDYDYLWHDNSTLREYHVSDDGWHVVTVTATRGNGCYLKDSTYVELLFNDAGAENLIYPVNHCGLTKNEFLTVRIKNFGTDSINSGQKIAVAYQMNGGLTVSDTLKLSSTLHSKKIDSFYI